MFRYVVLFTQTCQITPEEEKANIPDLVQPYKKNCRFMVIFRMLHLDAHGHERSLY